jgi:hypothetical protein
MEEPVISATGEGETWFICSILKALLPDLSLLV